VFKEVEKKDGSVQIIFVILSDKFDENRIVSLKRRGSEAIIVYIIK
jgi:hypothetical protein